MSDPGRPLSFGAFLTPGAADADRTVALAVLAEQVGLDLVTFSDHPYQPAFLDTWTLLSFVAARTSRVHLAANVTNLPLRPPAVLARSVAALDLLSGGRVELGLGAGAFWDAIAAMGGQRLTGGQAVQALEEAIDVVRQTWDAGARGGVRVEGEFHRVVGAKRGPAPAHDVGIWLGAYKPRMLALTGRRADGWLPSLSYLQPGDLARGNALIDEAAVGAGRSPADVRRLLNVTGTFTTTGHGPLRGPLQGRVQGALQGPAEQWAEELAELALAERISTFVLGSDDPDDLRRFAAEVAPAVRELVAAEGRTAVAAPPGPAAGTPAFPVAPTPDDGARRSDRQVWDESTRPTGPAPDPARDYTDAELAQGQHLVAIHDGLRSELAQVQSLVDQVAAGTMDVGTARSHISLMTMRQNKWTLGTYCEAYCRIVTTHHTIEDQSMFPHLRAGDPRLGPVIDRLEQEHHAIHDVLENVDRALVEFVGGSDGTVTDGMAGLRAAVDLLSDTLLSHLAYEERELVEPLARLGMH
ncbi:LLM class flavin-dependent oxidoreductase [Modestobacter roseus]|uniref:Alkanesulfonate monooxygenase SsuD/methylene tetrahydromethanopterin reductase-like flavin-dependent oxidoreductase (Luciferase family) n=1 Tax=Modestobacter roseus TaxID=1181884 RepID=A0A562IQN1_9ACTN|nr:LLM class flavin-dependent oxidoreductase [Modestobacter roseus]MQA34490.1 LLM class flavin-dependent oxidoreductase [Modestobacter roseus]TWH73023.1 alkanesulfonate monooxygenase SsuD/methylene tetrahydromethanopterin reductase-like flavin-dependent oxidoreductase (luciferase family) [Modestobacter roseus]